MHEQNLVNRPSEYALLATRTALLKPLGQTAVLDYIRKGRFPLITIAQGTVIHFEGEVCQKMEIVLAGEVAIERVDATGYLMSVARCQRDSILGANLLFARNPCYPMTLTAVQDSVILSIDRSLLFELLSNNPQFLRIFLELASDRAGMLGDQIRHYVNQSIRVCLVNFIRQEYERQRINPIAMNMSKKMLAEKIGVQRTSISRELAKMRQEGLVAYNKDTLTILDDRLK